MRLVRPLRCRSSISPSVMVLALLGCGSATQEPPVTPPPRVDNPEPSETMERPSPGSSVEPQLVGVWHGASAVGAGYDDVYLFFADGRYEFQVSQGICEIPHRHRERGRWEPATTTISAHERVDIVDGRVVSDEVGCYLEETREATVELDAVQVPLGIDACSPAETDESPAPCLRFLGRPWWRIAAAPEDWSAQ